MSYIQCTSDPYLLFTNLFHHGLLNETYSCQKLVLYVFHACTVIMCSPFCQRMQGECGWLDQHFCFQTLETLRSPIQTALIVVSDEVVQITAIKRPHLGILSSDYLC